MSCTISSTNAGGMMPTQMRPHGGGAQRMAENLFSKLDASNQGYITKSDLQSALDDAWSTESTDAATDVDALFSALDSDQDGQVTKSEFSDAVTKLSQQLDSHADAMRMQGAMGPMGAGGMPPPPPPPQDGEDDEGLTQDALAEIARSGSTSDTKRSSFLSSILDNFDAVDADSNGKVTRAEADAFRKQSIESGSASTAGTARTQDASSQSDRFALQLQRLMAAYGSMSGQDRSNTSTAIATTA